MHRNFLEAMSAGVFFVAIGLATSSAAGQSTAKPSDDVAAKKEAERALIRQVADGLKARDASLAATPKNWKPARTAWGDPDLSGV